MKKRWSKIALGLVVFIVAIIAVNAFVCNKIVKEDYDQDDDEYEEDDEIFDEDLD